MIPPIAKVVYEVRRALEPTRDKEIEVDGSVVDIVQEPKPPFEELTSAEREPLFAEILLYLQSGDDMDDAVGKAIVDALK